MAEGRIFKYIVIKNDILSDIEKEKYLPGDKIHSESELKQKYNVSSTTVVKALNELVGEGYLVRRQGEGTFVRRNVYQRQVLYSEDMNIDNSSKSTSETTYTCVSDPFDDEKISKKLGDINGENILISQIGVIGKRVWKIQNRFILSEKLDENSRESIMQGGSISKELGYTDNLINFPTNTRISSGKLGEAPDIIKKNITIVNGEIIIDEDKPLLVLRKLITDRDDNPIEYDINYMDSDILEINVEST